jgi:SPOR domain
MTTKAAHPSHSAGKSNALSRFYIVVWLALGAAGIFYLTIASIAPEALRSADAGTGGLDATNQKVAALSSTVSAVKATVEQTASKQAALTTGLENLRTDISGIKVKLTDLHAMGQASASASTLDGKPMPAPAKAQTQAIAVKRQPVAVPQIEGEVVSVDPSAGEAVSSEAVEAILPPVKAASKPVKLAAVAPAAKDPAKAAVPAAAKPYAVNLAVSTSPDALRQIWQLFQDQHGDLLTGLKPHSATSGGNVRLLAGPFASQAAAAAYCTKLVKEGMACSPTPMAGTPL